MLNVLSCWLQVRGALRAATVPVSIPQLLKDLSLLGLSSASTTVNAVITELVQVRCSPEALHARQQGPVGCAGWHADSALNAWGGHVRHSSPGEVLAADGSALGWLVLHLPFLLSFAVPAGSSILSLTWRVLTAERSSKSQLLLGTFAVTLGTY